MKNHTKLFVVFLFVLIALLLDFSSYALTEGEQDGEKTAETVFRNIQVLKGVPASQLQQIMAMFTASLGVRCNHCHTNPFDKDEKPTKQTARRMIQMVLELNRGKFGGRDAVTCYTCHRGQTAPATVLALGQNLWSIPQPQPAKPQTDLPSVDQILDRYVQSIGGRELAAKLTTRISKGSRIGADGVLVPEEVYQKAPDKLMVVTRYPGVAINVKVDGQRGWSSNNEGVSEIVGEELAELMREAAFHKEISFKEMYRGMNTVGKARVGDKEAFVVEASSRSGNPERLYFDTQTGLLIRRYKESKTVLGAFPFQTDYEDYQVVDGIRLPLTIRWSMPGRVWGRRIAEVSHDASIEDEQFAPRR